MSLKNLKRIVAQMLVLAIMLPNVTAKAITNDVNSMAQQEKTQVESVDNKNLDKTQQELGSPTKNEEKSVENPNTQSQEKDQKLNEATKENTEIKNEKVEEVKSEIKQEAKEEVKSETNPVQDATKLESKKEDKSQSFEGKKYTSKKVPVIMPMAYSEVANDEENRIEFKLKREALEELTLLEPMTKSNYELALSYNDGSYSYVNSFDTLDSAIDAAKTKSVSNIPEDVLPAVVNNLGQVVYSTNSMARVIKYQDGTNVSGNSNVYTDSSLSKAFTYVNQGYVDDVPILEDAGNSAKVLISGFEGWMNKNVASGNYDIIVVPLNQVTNPSYYSVNNGELYHYISSDLKGNKGHSIIVGKAPSYLRQGVKYLSYDGIHFYDGSNIENGLNNLINDYKAGNRNNSVNSGNPHYLYYNTLPFRSKTNYSADDLNRYINDNAQGNSKLRNIGGALKDAENRYGVNALLTLGVAINESGWGMSIISQSKNNLFGIKAFDSNTDGASSYGTPGDSVLDFTRDYISRGYSDPADWRYFGGYLGNKYRGANVKYASDPFWGEKAASYAHGIDKYLSGGVNNLKDTNAYQIGMARSNNSVVNGNGTLLYNVTNDTSAYGGYINTPFIISNIGQVNISGRSSYEIYPERNTPVTDGKYHGNYNWNEKAYIASSNISLINVFKPQVDVRGGSKRYDTAVELSKSAFNNAETVVIANGYALADGLTATPIASYHKAPLLLTETNTIPEVTKNEIRRLGARSVILVGGTGVINQNVENELRNLGIAKITRLGGANRYDTSLFVAKYIDENCYDVENIVVTNGVGEADALSIAPVSGRDKMPIILVEANNVPSNVYNWLKAESLNNAFLVGGTGVLTDNVLNIINGITAQNIGGNRLGGRSRYETNASVIERFYGNVTEKVYLAKGLGLVDALSSGPIAALNNSPVVLAGNELTPMQRDILSKRSTNVIVQAGYGVAQNVVESLRDLLSRTQ
ncbi:hypothetical protein JCM1393_07450 [Clostridium carnis]